MGTNKDWAVVVRCFGGRTNGLMEEKKKIGFRLGLLLRMRTREVKRGDL